MKITDEVIMGKIFIIRGHKVMLDKDLAELYRVETKTFNQAVRRNLKRFPPDFMFSLSEKEWENLRSQFVTSSWGGTRYLPNAFTEQGVAMIASILNSEMAISINIQIVRVFTRVRQMLFDNTELRLALDQIRKKTDNNSRNIELVFQYLDDYIKNQKKQKPRKAVGYKIPKSKGKARLH